MSTEFLPPKGFSTVSGAFGSGIHCPSTTKRYSCRPGFTARSPTQRPSPACNRGVIVYGVSAEVSISQLFIAGVLPGILLAALFSGYIMVWALRHPEQVPAADVRMTFMQKLSESRSLIPVVLLIAAVLGSIYTGFATATEAAAVGVVGSLVLSAVQGSMTWSTFKDSLMGATRLYCMIDLLPASPVHRVRVQTPPAAYSGTDNRLHCGSTT